MAATRRILWGGAAVGAVGAGASLAVHGAGRRIASRADDRIDALLVPPEDVTHHRVPSFDGGVVHVAERGSGPPMVLLHGVTLQWDVWSPLLQLMAPQHRVVTWDMRGHGTSVPGDEGVSLGAVATDLATVLGELDIEGAVVVGHSMGGMALGRFMVHHGGTARHRVRHSVFLATSAAPMHPVAHDPDSIAHQAAVTFATVGMGSRVRYDWRDGNLSRVLLRRAFGRNATAAAVEQLRRMTAEMSPEALTEAAHAIVTHDIRDALAANELPATVVTGTMDRLTPPRHARMLVRSLGGADLHLLDGVGHQVMQEDPHALAGLLHAL